MPHTYHRNRFTWLAYSFLAFFGFLLYWRTHSILPGLIGLFVTGVGVAAFYPLILSLAIGAAGAETIQASARATLASGVAILTLPLVLRRLADAIGIRTAYGVVMLLLVGIFLIIQLAGRSDHGHQTSSPYTHPRIERR